MILRYVTLIRDARKKNDVLRMWIEDILNRKQMFIYVLVFSVGTFLHIMNFIYFVYIFIYIFMYIKKYLKSVSTKVFQISR